MSSMIPLLDFPETPKTVVPKRLLQDRKGKRINQVVALWNRMVEGTTLPAVRVITEKRASKVGARLKAHRSREFWEELFGIIRNTRILHDRVESSWFDFDFVVRSEDNIEKIRRGWMSWRDKKDKVPQPKSPVTKKDIELANILLQARPDDWELENLYAPVQEIRKWVLEHQVFMPSNSFLEWYIRFIREKQEWRETLKESALGTEGQVWKSFVKVLKKAGVDC